MPTSKHGTVEYILAQAWTHCAPGRNKNIPFPTGFWPDVARIAVEMALGLQPSFDALSSHRSGLETRPPRARSASRRGKISSAEKAANTAALLAKLKEQS